MAIAKTPEPPYYAVIACTELKDDTEGLDALLLEVFEYAQQQEGFLAIEYCEQPGFSMAVSYWKSEDAIKNWARHGNHMAAKKLGKERWFSAYITRIALVERCY